MGMVQYLCTELYSAPEMLADSPEVWHGRNCPTSQRPVFGPGPEDRCCKTQEKDAVGTDNPFCVIDQLEPLWVFFKVRVVVR